MLKKHTAILSLRGATFIFKATLQMWKSNTQKPNASNLDNIGYPTQINCIITHIMNLFITNREERNDELHWIHIIPFLWRNLSIFCFSRILYNIWKKIAEQIFSKNLIMVAYKNILFDSALWKHAQILVTTWYDMIISNAAWGIKL